MLYNVMVSAIQQHKLAIIIYISHCLEPSSPPPSCPSSYDDTHIYMCVCVCMCVCIKPTPVFLPGESHGLRNLAGCSPYGHTESDTEAT